jgi:hypothetical protein
MYRLPSVIYNGNGSRQEGIDADQVTAPNLLVLSVDALGCIRLSDGQRIIIPKKVMIISPFSKIKSCLYDWMIYSSIRIIISN